MDRRRASLVLLLAFVVCTGTAIVLSGSRPGLQQGVAPTVAQFVGYLLALAAGVLLVTAANPAGSRRTGWIVLGAVAVLVLLDLVAAGGPNIGAGAARLLLLVVIGVATARLSRAEGAARRIR